MKNNEESDVTNYAVKAVEIQKRNGTWDWADVVADEKHVALQFRENSPLTQDISFRNGYTLQIATNIYTAGEGGRWIEYILRQPNSPFGDTTLGVDRGHFGCLYRDSELDYWHFYANIRDNLKLWVRFAVINENGQIAPQLLERDPAELREHSNIEQPDCHDDDKVGSTFQRIETPIGLRMWLGELAAGQHTRELVIPKSIGVSLWATGWEGSATGRPTFRDGITTTSVQVKDISPTTSEVRVDFELKGSRTNVGLQGILAALP